MYKKSMRGLLVLMIVLGFVLSCAEYADDSGAPFEHGMITEDDVHKAALDLDAIARNIAPNLAADEETLSLLYEEMNRCVDGDAEILFGTISTRVMSDGSTFRDRLCTTSGESTSDTDSLIDDVQTIMQLQFYMPNHEAWDGVTTPLVGFVPVNIPGDASATITAYDADGNAFIIDESNYRQRPIIVLGPNEKADLSDAAVSADDGQEGFIADETPGHNYGDKELLYGMSISDTHEPWYLGSPEIYIKTPGGRTYIRSVAKKNTWYDFGTGIVLFTWNESYGETVNMEVYENDFDPVDWFNDPYGIITVNFSDGDRTRYETVQRQGDQDSASVELGYNAETPGGDLEAPTPIAPKGVLQYDDPSFGVRFQWTLPTGALGIHLYVLCDDDVVFGTKRQVWKKDYISAPNYFLFSHEFTFQPGVQYYWRAYAYNYNTVSRPCNDTAFKFPSVTASYTFTVDARAETGVLSQSTHRQVNANSSIVIMTVQSYQMANGTIENFSHWTITGNAQCDNTSLASTIVYGFGSDTKATAVYESVPTTPAPSNVPTAAPTAVPTFTLTVKYKDPTGADKTDTHTGLNPASVITVNVPNTFSVGNPNGIMTIVYFSHWTMTGTATLSTSTQCVTDVRGFGSDVTLFANYNSVEPTAAPLPTSGPTSPPSATPAASGVPTPVPTIEPVYSLMVIYNDANGAGKTDTYKVRTGDTTTINVPSEFKVGNPSGIVTTIKFTHWIVNGSATVGNVNSPVTTVYNVKSNTSLNASYSQQ